MKASKSPEKTEVTPSKKKLKQARLPFKIISEASSSPVSPVTPPSRKRKLSATEAETIAKAGKISKENDVVDLVVLSDDDSKDKESSENKKLPNPYVKLVDAAWKKKIQKAKAGRKKRGSKKTLSNSEIATENGSVDENTTADVKGNDSDAMDVDEPVLEKDTKEQKDQFKTASMTVSKIDISDIVDLDSSSCDVQGTSNIPEKSLKPESKGNSEDETSKNSTDSLDTKKSLSEATESSNTELSHASESKNYDSSNENLIKETDEFRSTNKLEPKLSQSDKQDLSHTNEMNSKIIPQSTATQSDNDTNLSENKDSDLSIKETDKEVLVTPKRSLRKPPKVEENNNKGSPTNKLNDSTISNPTTPKQSRSSSVTKLDESLNESVTSNANLTPKQLQKKAESAKKREEREKERLEREKKKQQEKEEREKQKQEKEEQKKKEREEREEAKRKEREEKDEQRKKEKEEKEKQKDMERKLREEKEAQKKKEKEAREEEKRKEKEAREEEKRKKTEAQELEKQEQELKKKKAAEAFLNFFVPKQKIETEKQATVDAVTNNMLSNFTIKSDMRLAPTTRVNLTEERAKQLEMFITEQNVQEGDLYLKSLKSGFKPLSSGKTWPLSDKEEDDVILVEDELPPLDGALESVTCEPVIREKLRPKLFSFHENRRPPYYGTWRKKSAVVKPRRPFGQDEKQLDYEVDSDEDWEEEQEGESIDGSAAGSDDELGPDEYEVDNEVFVPHGYLSDEEATMDEDDVLSLSPETQKARLKQLEDEFELEMKKPTEKLKPRLYGLFWETKDGGKPDNCADAIWNYFGKLSMVMNDPTPFLQPSNDPVDQEKKKVKKKKVTPEGEQNPVKEKRKKAEEKNKIVQDNKKVTQDIKKNQPGINMFLAKIKPTS